MAKKIRIEVESKEKIIKKRKVPILLICLFIVVIIIIISFIILINNEKPSLPTPDECFEIYDNSIIGYDETCTKDIVIPKTINGKKITIIGEKAFSEKKIESVVIPEGIKKIKKEAFWRNNLTEIIIPDSVTTINGSAFMSNKIKKIHLGRNLTFIGSWSFDGNYIENLVIPDMVKTIKYEAFANNNLKKVVIGKSVDTMEYAVFGQYNWDEPFYLNDGGEQNQKLTQIINKTGREFDWYDVIAYNNTVNGPKKILKTGVIDSRFGIIKITD